MNPLSMTKTTLVSLSLALGVLACSSSTTSGGSNTNGDAGDSSSGAPTFTEVYTVLQNNMCTTHHAAGMMDSFLDLSTQSAAFMSLVGAKASGPACGTSNEVRVVAGSPSTSLLYQKLSMATPPCGKQMPYNGTPLTAADQKTVSDWIAAGAQNN